MADHHRPNDPSPLPQLLTKRDVAERCQVSESTVKRWIATGELPAVYVGHRLRVRPEALEQFIRDAARSRCFLQPGAAS